MMQGLETQASILQDIRRELRKMNRKLKLLVDGIEYRAELAARKAYGKQIGCGDAERGPTPREACEQAYNAALKECGSDRLARKLANKIAKEEADTG